MTDVPGPRRRPHQIAKSVRLVVPGQSDRPSAPAGRRVRTVTVSAKEAAQAAEARRRQDCTYDASLTPTDHRRHSGQRQSVVPRPTV